jgi:hypothetical protein
LERHWSERQWRARSALSPPSAAARGRTGSKNRSEGVGCATRRCPHGSASPGRDSRCAAPAARRFSRHTRRWSRHRPPVPSVARRRSRSSRAAGPLHRSSRRARGGPSSVWSSGASLGSGCLSNPTLPRNPMATASSTTNRDVTQITHSLNLTRLFPLHLPALSGGCRPAPRSSAFAWRYEGGAHPAAGRGDDCPSAYFGRTARTENGALAFAQSALHDDVCVVLILPAADAIPVACKVVAIRQSAGDPRAPQDQPNWALLMNRDVIVSKVACDECWGFGSPICSGAGGKRPSRQPKEFHR